jgi:hypothetical protein
MSLDEDIFLREIKYEDSILDNEETLKYIDKKPMIKIANNNICKSWTKNKRKDPITKEKISKSGLRYKSFEKICKDK